MDTRTVHVAVGVILDSEQRILIALRPEQIHQGGLWEFPGGKVEADETVQQALVRELAEELGIEVKSCRALLEIHHDYGDKMVLLDVWWVDQFSGEAKGLEGQPVKWVQADELSSYAFPQANRSIVEAVQAALLTA